MSFGVSIGDILMVTQLAKETVHNCRCAPNDFAEASRVSQSLYLILEGVKKEYENPDSLLHVDDRTRTDFAIHFKNCETALKPLADLVSKYKSLSSTNIRIIDRFRFPKREYLEHRGNLAFYTGRLSEFLHMVGLGSLGRIEQKVEDIKEHLPHLMHKLDQMCAEFRIIGDKESVLSDHTDDEKFVWKTFRRKLNDAGFTSNVLRQHESALFLRIRELTECGLLESDGSSSVWADDEDTGSPRPVHCLPFSSITTSGAVESDAESDKILTPRPSIKDLRSKKSSDSVRSLRRRASEPSRQEQESVRQTNSGPRRAYSVQVDMEHVPVPASSSEAATDSPRIWRNQQGKAIIKGTFANKVERDGQFFITIHDTEKQEVWIPMTNLGDVDIAFAENMLRQRTTKPRQRRFSDESTLRNVSSTSLKTKEAQDMKEEVINRHHRSRPKILTGKRSTAKVGWLFREMGFYPPDLGPVPIRSRLTSDLLPYAASKGDLAKVKRLLAGGEHIESKGPVSWTETITTTDSEGNTQTSTKRHSYPETTALFRAASAGRLNVVHFLLRVGADVDTRDGWDGRIGDPILFKIVRNGDENVARCLLEYGAKMEAWGPTTALHIASSCPKRNMVRLVLEHGAYIDAKDHLSQTPVYLASVGGFAGIVQILLEEGARTNILTSKGQTALYKAGGKGRDDIVEMLLRYGADPGLGYGRLGETLIYKAAWYNEIEVVDLLLTFEADVDKRNKRKMETYRSATEKIMHGVVAGISKDHALMNAWNKTALHAAAYRGHEEMVELLLEAGADIEASGNDGLTPLYLAAQQKHKGVVQILLKAGAQLETERHDPVLALINERNKTKNGKGRELVKDNGHGKQMAKMGISDPLVSLVAEITKSLSTSRRIGDRM